jgi:hypothetical protein
VPVVNVARGASHTTAVQFSNKFVDFCIEGFRFEHAPVTKEAQIDDVAGARRGMIEIQWCGHCAYEHLGEAILALPQEQRQKFTIDDVSFVMMKRLVAS